MRDWGRAPQAFVQMSMRGFVRAGFHPVIHPHRFRGRPAAAERPRPHPLLTPRVTAVLLAAVLALILAGPLAARPADAPVHTFRVPVTSFALRVNPAEQTVPVGVPARVAAWVELPDPGAAYAPSLTAWLQANYTVRAALYLPYLDPDTGESVREVECPVGGEFRLDNLAEPGRYWLREIRLVSRADGRDFVFAQPGEVAVDVGGDLFIAWVTAEPMSWEEMNAAGVVFDDDSYQNYNFVIGFELEGQVVEYDFPMVQMPALPVTPADWSGLSVAGDGGGCMINELDLDVSGLAIPGLPATTVRLPGLILIPGSVGFLRQHFQVVLMLVNALPSTSGYALSGLEAYAALPSPGECPADAPLCLATLADSANAPLQPVVGAGGSDLLAPGESGSAQWVVVGRQVGYHEFPIRIEGMLRTAGGDQSWPISGSALGGIAVRDDPRFRLSFIHPDRVERGRAYDVTAHVTNISTTPAEGFRLAIQPGSLTGAEWVEAHYPEPMDDEFIYTKGTLAPGETVVLRYTLRALRSGMVTATYADADHAGLQFGVSLVFGVDTDGMPMNADRLILPPVVRRAWDEPGGGTFEETALHFLGLCHTLSTAGSAPLPDAFPRVDRGTPPALARALTESALALLAGMPRSEAAALLVRDTAALAVADDGFRRALLLPPGEAFRQALAAEIGGGDTLAATSGSGGDFDLLESGLALTGGDPGALALPAAGGELRWLPRSGAMADVRLGAASAGVHSLILWVPSTTASYRRLSYSIDLSPGDGVVVPAAVLGGASVSLQVVRSGGAAATVTPMSDQSVPLAPFRLVGVLKLNPDLLSGADPFGRGLLAVLNRRISLGAGQATAVCRVADNDVLAAAPLVSGRVLGVVTNRPVGKFTPATLTLEGLRAADGALLATTSAPVTVPDPDSAFEAGARVQGRVRYPAGGPVANPGIELWGSSRTWRGLQDVCVSRFTGAADGTFALPFVWMNPTGMFLVATDPSTGARRRVSLAIAGDGQLLEPEILMYGTGTVVGEVVTAAGAPRTDIYWVRVRGEGDGRVIPAVLDGGGRFQADGVAVGPVQVEALLSDRRRIAGSTYLGQPGEVAALLLVAGAGAVGGQVREEAAGPGGGTVVQGVPNARVELTCPGTLSGQTAVTDEDGRFRFEGVPPGAFRIRAVHPAAARVALAEGTLPEQAGADVELNLLFVAGAPLTVEVLADPGASPVFRARVEVELEDAFEQFRVDATTDFNGRIEFQGLPSGRYRITAGRSGETTSVSQTVWLGATGASITLRVQAAAAVQGLVRHADGSPAGGAKVRLGPAETTADGTGRFAASVPPGSHRFQAWTVEEAESGMATVAATGTDLEIRLRGKRTVRGTVKALQNGGGFMFVQVPLTLGGLFRNGTGEMEYRPSLASTLSVAADGSFAFSGVWDGPFEVRFSGNTFYTPARANGTLAGTDVDNLELQVVPVATTGTVTGILRQRDGVTPARAGIPLTLTGPDRRVRDARTAEGGAFAFSPPIPAGLYVLEAQDLYSGDRAWQELYFTGTGDQAVTLAMLGRHTLRVHLFSPGGEPLADAWLSLTRQGRPALERQADTVWDSDFTGGPGDPPCFVFEDLWSGDYSVTATTLVDGAVQSVSGGVTLAGDGTEADLTLTLAPTVTLHGTVLDGPPEDGGRPVTGAEITLRDAGGRPAGAAVTSAEMATQGEFVLNAVLSGHYTLEALDFATGKRASLGVDVDAAADDPPAVTLVLEPLGAVTGVVFAAADPPPHDCQLASGHGGIALTLGIHPAAGSAYPERTLAGTTGPDGRFEFHGVPGGRISLEVRSGTGVTGYGETVLAPNGEACLAVTLADAYTVSGRVRRAGGIDGAPFARVELQPGQPGSSCTPGGRSYRATADADGFFTFADVLAGCYTAAAWTGSGMNRVTAPLAVDADTGIELEVRGLGSVQGTVTDSTGFETVGRARVTLSADGLELAADAGADGQFFFPEAPAGSFQLRAEDAPTGRIGEASGDLADGQAVEDFLLPLEPSFALTGYLQSEQLQPLNDVRVTYTLVRPDGRIVVRSFDSESGGWFGMSHVPLLPGWLTVDDPVYGRCRTYRSLDDIEDGGLDDVGILILDATPPQVAVEFVAGTVLDPGQPVPLDAHIRLAFDGEMDLDWLAAHPNWATLTRETPGGPASVGLAVVPWPDRKTVELHPVSLLDSSAYRLVISGQVPDGNGNLLGDDVEVLFRTVDTTPPTVTAVSPHDHSVEILPGTEVVITFSEPLDPASGAVDWQRNGQPEAVDLAWSADGTTLTLLPPGGLAADGRHIVTLSGWQDRSGNALTEPFTFTFDTLDTQPPEIGADACGAEYSEARPVLAFPYHDALADVDPASVYGELSGSMTGGGVLTPVEASAAQVLFQLPEGLANGEWILTVHAADTRGHEGVLACSFTYAHSEILFLDHAPAEGALAVGDPLAVTVRFWSARPPVEAVLVLGGTTLSAVPAVEDNHYRADISYHVPQDGFVAVSAQVTDDHGFTSAPLVFTFLADAYAPGLSPHVPQVMTCDDTPSLSFTCSDMGSGVNPAATQVWIDQDDRTAEFAITPSGGTWDSETAAPLTPGGHTLKVRVEDFAAATQSGHQTYSEAGFRIDDTPPFVTNLTPGSGQVVTGDQVTFQAHLTDNCGLDPATAAVELNGQAWTEFELAGADLQGTLPWDDPRLVLGDNTWTVRVRDLLGNEGSATGTFQISRTVPLPFALADGNGYEYQVETDGALSWDPLVPGERPLLPDVTVWIGGVPYGLEPRAEGVVAQDRTEIRVDGPLDAESRRLEQRVQVDPAGCQARVQAWLSNADAAAVPVTVEAAFTLPEALGWAVTDTSSGDAAPDPADGWLVVDDAVDQDDALGLNLPALGILFAGEYPARGPDEVVVEPGRLALRWIDLPLPPGTPESPGRLGLALAVTPQPTRAAAAAALDRLAAGPAELFAGVPEDRWSQVVNLDWAGGPDPALEPLPALTGGVAGVLRDATPEGYPLKNRPVLARSQSPYLSRARTAVTDFQGRFALGAPDRSPALPLGDVEILAGPAECGLASAGMVTLAEADPVQAGLDLPAAGTGAVDLTVRLSAGGFLPFGSARLEDQSGTCSFSLDVHDGFALFAGIPAGDYTLTLSSDFGGAVEAVTVAAGAVSSVEVVLTQRVLAVRVVDDAGQGVPGAVLYVFAHVYDGPHTTQHGPPLVADAGGTAVMLDPPGDTPLDLLVLHPDGRWAVRNNVSVPADASLRLDNVFLQPAGSVRARAEDAAGQPLAGVGIRLSYPNYPLVPALEADTGAAGEAVFPGVPPGLQLAWAVRPDASWLAMYEFWVAVGRERLLLYTTTAGVYTIQGTVLAADDTTPVPWTRIELRQQVGAGVYETVTADTTDQTGFYRFQNVPLPSARIRLAAPWPSSQGPGEGVLDADASAGGNLAVPGGISLLAVEVRDAQGDLVPGADYLDVQVHDSQLSPPLWSGAAGVFRLFGARPAALYDLSAGDGQGGFYCATGGLPSGQLQGPAVILTPGTAYALGGTLQAADGATPLPNYAVHLFKEAPDGTYYPSGEPACTDAFGSFFWESLHLPTGRARLAVGLPDSQGGGEESLDVDLAAGGDVAFPTSVTVAAGTVQDGAGNVVDAGGWLGVIPQAADWPEPPAVLCRLGQGAFTVFGLLPGQAYDLLAYDNDWNAYGGTLQIPAGESSLSGAVLLPQTVDFVEGTLRAADGQTPLPYTEEPRLEKELAGGEYVNAGPVYREGDGYFYADGHFPTGRVRLRVPRPASQGGGEDLFPLALPDDAWSDLATGWAVAAGDVRDGSGTVVADARDLDAIPADGARPPLGWRQADLADGQWTVLGLAPGVAYTLVAWDSSGGFYCAGLTLGAGQPVAADVHLEPCVPTLAEVHVRLLDTGGQPVAGANVSLVAATGAGGSAVTDAAGWAVLPGVPPGGYRVILEYQWEGFLEPGNGLWVGYLYVPLGSALVEQTLVRPDAPAAGLELGCF